jgi:hypothetical protein
MKDSTGAGWQPIETAPKDRTTILIFKPGTLYNGEPAPWYDVARWDYVDNDQSEMGWASQDGCLSCVEPTHWMPLPEPPAGRAALTGKG